MKYQQGLAYDQLQGSRGSVIFCGGLGSTMQGTKATALYMFCEKNDIALTRFDYAGHGNSKGKIQEGNISKWLSDSLNVLENLTNGKQIIIGSSMGGWIMLLMSLRFPERIKGLMGIAAAPDFTDDIEKSFSAEQKKQIDSQGYTYILGGEGYPPYIISGDLITDGRKNLVLNKEKIPINCPVRLLHGMKDNTVHYSKSLELVEKLESTKVTVELLKNSDHSMNDGKSLESIYKNLLAFIE